MTDRRSQYEGVDVGPVMETSTEIPLGDTSDGVGKTPKFPKEKARAPETPTVKVHAEAAPVQPVIYPEPKSADIDIDDRDPTRLNSVVKVEFEDTFAEPDGSHSFNAIWKTSFLVFNSTKLWCYKILTAIFAVPCALCWGIHFACVTFDYIWCIQPYLKSVSIHLKAVSVLWLALVRAICDPVFESIGKMCSNIRLTLKKDH